MKLNFFCRKKAVEDFTLFYTFLPIIYYKKCTLHPVLALVRQFLLSCRRRGLVAGDGVDRGITTVVAANFLIENFGLDDIEGKVLDVDRGEEGIGNVGVGIGEGEESKGGELPIFHSEVVERANRASIKKLVELSFESPIVDEVKSNKSLVVQKGCQAGLLAEFEHEVVPHVMSAGRDLGDDCGGSFYGGLNGSELLELSVDGLGDGHENETFGFLFSLIDFVDLGRVGGSGRVVTHEGIIVTPKHGGCLDLHGPVKVLSLGGEKRDPREHGL